MKTKARYAIVFVLFALLLSACGSTEDTQEAIETFISQTQQISQLETAAAGAGAAPQDQGDAPDDGGEEAVADTPTPSDTPTITLTPTPAIPQVSVSQATNCRTGPAVYYTYQTTINVGQIVEVVGVHAQGNDYVIVKNPNGAGNCWLWLQHADKTDFSGYGLTAYNTPPTPTPTYTPTPSFDWNATWELWVEGGPVGSVAINQSGNSISGSFPFGGDTISFSGSLSANYQVATGTWENSSGPTGTFQWQIKSGNLNQFVGNIDGGADAWCGAKNSASQPSPCLWP